MVRIPTYDNYGITGVNTQEAYQQSQATPQAFGSEVGAGMQNLAGNMGQALQQVDKIKMEMDTLDVETLYNNEVSVAFRDIDKSYTSLMGKNAVDGYEEAQKKVEALKTATMEKIQDPRQKMMMGQFFDRRATQSGDLRDRHLEQQFRIYKEDTFNSSRAMTVQNGVDFANDPVLFDQYRRTNEHLIEDYGLQNGWPAEKIELEKRKDRDALVSQSVQMLATADPMRAMEFLRTHQDQISPEIMGKGRKVLEPYYEQMAVSDFMAKASTGLPVEGYEINKPKAQAPSGIKRILDETANKYAVPASLVHAVAFAESGYDPNAGSPAGAVGLMQLMPATAKDLGIHPDERTDPVKSADGGVRYLAQMMNRYDNNVALALGAYNAGPGNMDKAIKKAGGNASIDEILNNLPKPEETVPYVKKILKMSSGGVEKPRLPVAMPQNEAEIEVWRSEMMARAGGIYRKEQISAVNMQAEQMKRLFKARNDEADRLFHTARFQQLEATGANDLTALKQDPRIAEILPYVTPSLLMSVAESERKESVSRGNEIQKQDVLNRKEASERTYISRYGQMKVDPAFAKTYNPAKDPELLPDDMEKLWKLKDDIEKRDEKQIASDPLHDNLKQGVTIFDEVFKANNAGMIERLAPQRKDYKDTANYLILQGMVTEAILSRQKQAGNKVLTADEQRKIAEDIFAKRGYSSSNWSGGTTEETASLAEAYPDLVKAFPNASPAQIQAGVQRYLQSNAFKGTEDLKKALKGEGLK